MGLGYQVLGPGDELLGVGYEVLGSHANLFNSIERAVCLGRAAEPGCKGCAKFWYQARQRWTFRAWGQADKTFSLSGSPKHELNVADPWAYRDLIQNPYALLMEGSLSGAVRPHGPEQSLHNFSPLGQTVQHFLCMGQEYLTFSRSGNRKGALGQFGAEVAQIQHCFK